MCLVQSSSYSSAGCYRVATSCETASLWLGCRVVPTVSHRISTINAGGMAALLRPQTTDTTPSPQEEGLVGSVADETLTLNYSVTPLHLLYVCV